MPDVDSKRLKGYQQITKIIMTDKKLNQWNKIEL